MKNKKMLIETIIIPLCVLYLLFTLLNNHETISQIVCYSVVCITSIVCLVKYINEVYIYEHKYNYLKIIFIIINILLLISLVLTIFVANEILSIIFIVLVGIELLYLLIFGILNIIIITKNNEKLYQSIIRAFFSLLSFSIIFPSLIIFN